MISGQGKRRRGKKAKNFDKGFRDTKTTESWGIEGKKEKEFGEIHQEKGGKGG